MCRERSLQVLRGTGVWTAKGLKESGTSGEVGDGEDRAQIKKNIAMGGVHCMDIFLEWYIILQSGNQ